MLRVFLSHGALVLVAAGGIGVGLAVGSDAREGAADLAGALAREGLAVTDVAWEDDGEGIGAALAGKWALVVASENEGRPRDLYRVRARVAAGDVVHVDALVNLTRTPHADEGELAVADGRAAYRARSFGQVSAVVVLDLRLDQRGDAARFTGANHWMASVTNAIETGRARGLARTRLRFQAPPDEVSLSWADGALGIRWRAGEATWTTRGVSGRSASSVEVASEAREPKRPILWAVDTVRSFVGTAPIAWLETKVFAVADVARRTRYRMSEGEEAAAAPDRLGPYVAVGAGTWPPPRLHGAFAKLAKGEGEWRPSAPEWLRKLPGAPPAFYETFVRPDLERPYSRVLVLAMDGRQLELGMEGGFEDPEPTTGAYGSGKIPRRPEVLDNLVAAFNGAFKTEHGEYGMMVEGRVLLPPVPGGATVATFADGRIGLGSWDADPSIPPGMVSFRQNLEPLVADGVLNPTRRRIWGWARGGSSMEAMQTHRSGVCEMPGGHMAYLWGEDVNWLALGRAMLLAGCSYGIHLDMNPYHTSLYWLRVDDHAVREIDVDYKVRPMDPRMIMGLNRYLKWAPKDFFYVTLRRAQPAPLPGATWSAEGMPQPEPAFMPAVYRTVRGGVRVVSIRTDRVDVAVRAATTEPATGTGEVPPSKLQSDVARRALLGFGAGRPGTTFACGIVIGRRVYFPLREGEPALVRTESGEVTVAAWPVAGAVDAVQGSWLGRGEEREGGAAAAAVGVTADGRLVYGDGPEGALADALAAAGVVTAMKIDRGAAATPMLDVAGAGLQDSYDQAAVYVLGGSARQNVFRLNGERAELATVP